MLKRGDYFKDTGFPRIQGQEYTGMPQYGKTCGGDITLLVSIKVPRRADDFLPIVLVCFLLCHGVIS